MKILLGGACGKLGNALLKRLTADDYEVLGIDRTIHDVIESQQVSFRQCDVTNRDELKGICDGVDCVISTIGLTTSSREVTHYDIDLKGNVNLLNEALAAGVKKFVYISVIKCDQNPAIPMLNAKYQFEKVLKDSGITYGIYRPTGYFYDISKVFKPMIEKGKVTLIKGKTVSANVIHTADFADFIVRHLTDRNNETVEIGGKESYNYETIAKMFFEAAGKPVVIKYASPVIFDILGFISRITKNGKYANIQFGKWTLTHDMEASVKYGDISFAGYIKQQSNNPSIST